MLWLMPADLLVERIGMGFISIDAPSDLAQSVVVASATRAPCPLRPHGHQKSGGKGGNPFLGPYSGTQVFRDRRRGAAKGVAEIAETPRTHHRGMSEIPCLRFYS